MSGARYIPTILQETCLTPEPAAPASILQINANSSSQSWSSIGRKRPFDEINDVSEEAYSRKYLASEASIFFRRRARSPHSILWRILDNRQLLELQSVDLIQSRQHAKHESCLTFHVSVAAIVPGGVALADPEANDGLEVFILTTANELYTVTLNRDLLARNSLPKDFDSTTCIRKQALSSLSFHRPYKLVVTSATELLISLHDGGFIRLERDSTSHSAAWKETFFTEAGWTGTLRGLIPLKRHQTIPYGEVDLEPSAVVALAKSPDGQHIWAVSLDHELSAWSTRTGKVVARRDLMGARRDPNDKRSATQYTMPAKQGNLLKIFAAADHTPDIDAATVTTTQYQAIVYSPKDRAFKLFFAKPTSNPDDPPRIHDVGPVLSLPFDELLNTNLWRCTDFHVKADAQWETLQLWVSIQSGASTRIMTMILNLFDEDGLVKDWQQKWNNAWTVVTESSTKHVSDGPVLKLDDSTTPAKQWTEYLLYPGRFSRSSLETALHMYRQKRKLQSTASKSLKTSQQSFMERLCTSITAKIPLPNHKDYDAYYGNVQAQWDGYHSILLELHDKRSEMLGFAFDSEDGLAWLIHADFVAPVRSTGTLNRLRLNQDIDADEEQYDSIDEDVKEHTITTESDWDNMKFLAAVQNFSTSLPKAYQQHFSDRAISEALSTHGESSSPARAKTFFDQVDVGQHVTDEAYQSLETSLQPLNGIGGLVDQSFTALMKTAVETGHRGVKSEIALSRYGGKLMIAAAQEFIQQDKRLLLDLLVLVAFINNDFEPQALDDGFNASRLFHQISSSLRHAELRDWLTRNVCVEPSGKQIILSTVFETLFIGDWDSHAPKTLSFAEKLTHWSRQWAFATFTDWHGFTANIFSTLLRHEMYELAFGFTHFLQDSAWTRYLRARLSLALGEQEEAAILFQAAAEGLSDNIKGDLDTAGFLTAEELSNLGQGPGLYRLHVANLFEKLRSYAYTADFAQQALSYIDQARVEHDFEVIDGRKKSTRSPVETVANARAEVQLLRTRTIWEDIVSRLFNALVQTGRFEEAFMTLQKFKSPELQKSNLQKLIDSCVKNDILELVLELPFDETTEDAADAILVRLAKKAATPGVAMRPAQQVLYAFRIRRGNYRGAAQVLYEHLDRLRRHTQKSLRDPEDETLLQAYLILINTLACCGKGEEWLLAEPIEGIHSTANKRKLVTLDDVRRDYVAELDRRSDLQHGRFPLIGGDDDDYMDVL